MTPEDLMNVLAAAGAAQQAGNLEEGERLAGKALEEAILRSDADVLREAALLRLAAIAGQRGNYDRALALAAEVPAGGNGGQLSANHAHAWWITGNVYESLGQYGKALEYTVKSRDLYEKLGKKARAADASVTVGRIFINLGSYDRALESFATALALHEELGEKSGIADVSGNIGIVCRELGLYDNALEYFTKALALHEELGEKSGIAAIFGRIGSVHQSLGESGKALEYCAKSLALHEELGEKSAAAAATGNMGIVCKSLGLFDKALEHFGKALAAYEDLGTRSLIAEMTGNIGTLFTNPDFEGRDAAKAEEHLLRAIALCEELGAKQFLHHFYKTMTDMLAAAGRKAEAFDYFEKFYEVEKEVQNDNVRKQYERFEYERKIAAERVQREEREKVVEELTLLNASLEEANREKNEVIGIVAHDLKNPISGILLTAENIRRYSPQLSRHDVEVQVQKIATAADRMKAIVMNLLDIQRIESGGFRLDIAPVSVKTVVEMCVAEYAAQASAKNISINAAIPAQEYNILADSSALQEVLDNLLSNAVKFSAGGSQIFAEVAVVPGGFVRISVKDQGPGLTKDDLAKARWAKGRHLLSNFNSIFFQPHNNITRNFTSKTGTIYDI